MKKEADVTATCVEGARRWLKHSSSRRSQEGVSWPRARRKSKWEGKGEQGRSQRWEG